MTPKFYRIKPSTGACPEKSHLLLPIPTAPQGWQGHKGQQGGARAGSPGPPPPGLPVHWLMGPPPAARPPPNPFLFVSSPPRAACHQEKHHTSGPLAARSTKNTGPCKQEPVRPPSVGSRSARDTPARVRRHGSALCTHSHDEASVSSTD